MNLTFVGPASGGGGGGSVAVYGRQDALPSVTNYDWVHMTREDGTTVVKRSAGSPTVKVSKTLSRGQWYIGILNDDPQPRTMRMMMGTMTKRGGSGSACPKDCSGRGICHEDGTCRCFPQFSGEDCTESKTLLLHFFPRIFLELILLDLILTLLNIILTNSFQTLETYFDK